MQKSNKRYTDHDREMILAALKVGAQNGIPQEIIAEQIAPLLCRKPSAINSQMYSIRSEWVKTIKTEMTLAYSKVKYDKEEIVTIETEYTEAIESEPVVKTEPKPEESKPSIEKEPELKEEPEATIIEFTPVLKPEQPKTKEIPTTPHPTNKSKLPAIGDEIEVVVIGIREFGAIVKASKYDVIGLIHISNITDQFVDQVDDWLYINQRVNAVAIKQENDGRYGFSTKHAVDKNVWKLGVPAS